MPPVAELIMGAGKELLPVPGARGAGAGSTAGATGAGKFDGVPLLPTGGLLTIIGDGKVPGLRLSPVCE